MTHSKLQIAPLIEAIHSDEEFHALASEWYKHQSEFNFAFKTYLNLLNRDHYHYLNPNFLPIELFKTLDISCEIEHDLLFRSSGTTADGERSTHRVYDKELYQSLAISHFEAKYGPLKEWVILALLPSYLENGDSSLVFMVDSFINSAHQNSKYLLHQPEILRQELTRLKSSNQKALLIGVSFALLDFCDENSVDSPELVVMETGGMKGKRKELTRDELHNELKKGFPNSAIHSEYGMTELLSQAYSTDGKWFSPPKWMKAYSVEISDPFRVLDTGQRGLLAFIDLANYHSCSFIQTRDIGIVNKSGQFTVEGRLDRSDLRGCNLLYS